VKPLSAASLGLGRRRTDAAEEAAAGNAGVGGQRPRNHLSLIEPSMQSSPPVKRHEGDDIDRGQRVLETHRQTVSQFLREKGDSTELDRMDDLPKGVVVEPTRVNSTPGAVSLLTGSADLPGGARRQRRRAPPAGGLYRW